MDDLKEQEAGQAVPFTTAFDIAPIVEEVRKSAQTTEHLREREEQVLLEGVDTDFWELIKKRLQLRITNLRSASSLRLGGKLDLQEIGLRAVIINEIADGFEEIIKMVELPKRKRLAQIADEEQKGGE